MTTQSHLESDTLTGRYETLLRISETIAAHRDSGELFRNIAGMLRQVVSFDFLSVVLYNEESHTLKLCVVETPGVQVDTEPRDFPPEETVSCWVYEHQQPLVVPDLDEEIRFPQFTQYLKRFGMRSVCALPLTTVHRRLGAMGIGRAKVGPYSEDEVRFLALVANQLALAIDDTLSLEVSERAQEEVQRKNERLKLVLDISRSVASTLDLRQLCRLISSSIRPVLQCDAAMLALPEPDSARLRVYGLDFPDGKGFLQEEMLIPVEKTPAG